MRLSANKVFQACPDAARAVGRACERVVTGRRPRGHGARQVRGVTLVTCGARQGFQPNLAAGHARERVGTGTWVAGRDACAKGFQPNLAAGSAILVQL